MMTNATMATRLTVLIRTVGVGLFLGLLLVLGAASAHAEESQPAKQKAAPEAGPSGTTAGPVEGLRVHGHWTIEVRNPDGTLVDRREFENALASPGGEHLVNVLARTRTAGTWRVVVGGSPHVCADSPGAQNGCFIVESTDPLAPAGNVFKTLTASVPAPPSGSPYSLVLNGSMIVEVDGSISIVLTENRFCSSSVAPDTCTGGSTTGLATLTFSNVTPIPVLAGQQVQVRVLISFS